MPSANNHLKNAQKHFLASQAVASADVTRAWGAVALFYTAHQLAHAVFDVSPEVPDSKKHPESHTNPDHAQPGTNTIIKRDFRWISQSYMDLYAISTGVRYKGLPVTPVRWAELMDNLRDVAKWSWMALDAAGHELPEWFRQLTH